ncbi:hypothetical protein NDU88_001181 [Pleurodeles waltl]|uniref:Uncharacterized protein n=1 Tax=Pleurodeles waltl TaxID=8319 RepID=A0AAV7R7U5_PLEWA|nr:hypothetical protein NDU88_001181 [Pleurodeles waltl]
MPNADPRYTVSEVFDPSMESLETAQWIPEEPGTGRGQMEQEGREGAQMKGEWAGVRGGQRTSKGAQATEEYRWVEYSEYSKRAKK